VITWDAYPAVPARTEIHPQTGREVKRPGEPPARVARLAFDHSGDSLLSVPASKVIGNQSVITDTIRLWGRTGTLIREFVAAEFQVGDNSVASTFYASGDRLVVAHAVETPQNDEVYADVTCLLKVWDLNSGQPLASGTGPGQVSDVAGLLDGRLLLVTPTAVWQMAADLTVPAVKIPGRPRASPKATRLAVSPDGKRFAAVGRSRATVWTSEGTALASRDHSKSPQNGPAAFRPDSTVLAVGHGTVVDLWDYGTGAEITLVGHRRPIWAVGFGPDARTVYTAASDGVVIAWDAQDGVVRQKFDFGTGKLYSAAVAPDGLTLALGGEDGRITVVDVE
jgi:WD40 repeat protein